MPHMNDPFFTKSVVYICKHEKGGAMGVIINKRFNNPELSGIFNKLARIENSQNAYLHDTFFGGPVLIEKGIVLHHSKYSSSNSVPISKLISITSDQNALKDLKARKDIPFKLIIGHAGWSAGQLENELENGDWLIQDATSDFIFDTPSKHMWRSAAMSLGMNFFSDLGTPGKA